MDYRKQAKEEFKKTAPKRGIYIIHNLENKKIFVGSAMNVEARINRCRFELAQGIHKNKELQQEYNAFGKTHFAFNVADVLEEKKEQKVDYFEELRELEFLWLEKVQPFGDRGYNIPT